MKELPKRIITAIFFGLFVLGSIYLGIHTFSVLLLLIGSIGLYELYKIARLVKYKNSIFLGVAGGMLALIIMLGYFNHLVAATYLPILLILPAAVLITELYRDQENPLGNVAVTILGWLYLVTPLILWLWSAKSFSDNYGQDASSSFLFGYIAMIWCSDTGAYFSGVWLGKHKLFERISPKKTWEGLFGGLILALISGFVISRLTELLLLTDWLIIAVIIVFAGTAGDLVESMFKRSAGVKDSGKILPGHGGVLDRFDSLFISAPFVFLYLLMTGHIS